MQMISFSGKQLLALIRESDYTHAGEEEAIEITLRNYPRRSGRHLLDVGCGLGGTANYVQDHGWGTVAGIDVERESIARARRAYPAIEFHACDVIDAASVLRRKYDLIYSFNSFYAFADRPRALAVLGQLASESGCLVLFDYTDRGRYHADPLQCDGEPFIPNPIDLSAIGATLRQAGWELFEVEDLTEAYDRWYDALIQRIDARRAPIISSVGAEGFTFVRAQYAGLLGAIRDGRLGGAIVHARRFPHA
jgi:cyclopropane fatty-acyl-phospholipid synthase-like methyltransferase